MHPMRLDYNSRDTREERNDRHAVYTVDFAEAYVWGIRDDDGFKARLLRRCCPFQGRCCPECSWSLELAKATMSGVLAKGAESPAAAPCAMLTFVEATADGYDIPAPRCVRPCGIVRHVGEGAVVVVPLEAR